MPHSSDKLIRFAKGIIIVLLSTFNTFVGMLLSPMVFLLFRLLIVSWISSGGAGVRKKFDYRGLVRKPKKCLLVFTILPLIFGAMIERNLLKMVTY